MMKRTVILVVLDGWGVGPKNDSNPIYVADLKNIGYIKHNFPSGTLQASGIAVGLPWEEEGNSEVGHLTLGAGRVIYQHYPRISIGIRNGSFFENAVLKKNMLEAKAAGKSVNLIGLLTDGNVHASIEHLTALLKMARDNEVRVNLHLFTDGKDSSPRAAVKLLEQIRGVFSLPGIQGEASLNRIGSIGGRYYGMDREGHQDRTEKAYEAILGSGMTNFEFRISNEETRSGDLERAIQYIEGNYENGVTDEFIPPITINPDWAVKEGDSVIFFNFREDSIRQLVEKFLTDGISNDEFRISNEKAEKTGEKTEDSKISAFKHLNIATFTKYSDKFNLPVAFPSEDVKNSLAEVLSSNGLRQLRIAETNKYAHATYFFNGLIEKPFPNEYRVLIPSQNVPHHDEHPEMMAREITARVLEAINERIYDFIFVNYANADIVAHTGNYAATLEAVKILDGEVGKLMEAVIKNDDFMIITADHGNAEHLMDSATGRPDTKHDISPVPIYLVAKELQKAKDDFDADKREHEKSGLLSDVAPTILSVMGIPQPEEMTGISLLKILE